MLFYLFCTILFTISHFNEVALGERSSLSNTPKNDDECAQEYSCSNCTAVRICRRNFNGTRTKIAELNCTKDKPFCDSKSGTCVKVTDNVKCNPVSYDFYCPTDGYYPNPVDCKKYYVCIEGVAFAGDCGVSFYNAKSENCQYTYTCYTINCYGKTGVKVAYTNNRSFFAYCYNSTIITFDKCPGQFQLDESRQICVPVCTQEGYQGDPYDCSKYYKCSYETSSVTLTLTGGQCPSGELFDSLNLRCAPKREGLQCTSGHVYSGSGKFIYGGRSSLIKKKIPTL